VGLPALGQKRETPLAQAAHRAQQRIPEPRINVELFIPAGFFTGRGHRESNSANRESVSVHQDFPVSAVTRR
jgi:hypothetical protein